VAVPYQQSINRIRVRQFTVSPASSRFEEDLEPHPDRSCHATKNPSADGVWRGIFLPPPALVFHRQHHLHRRNGSSRFRSSSFERRTSRMVRKARNLSRETSTDTRLGYRAVLQMEAGSRLRPAPMMNLAAVFASGIGSREVRKRRFGFLPPHPLPAYFMQIARLVFSTSCAQSAGA